MLREDSDAVPTAKRQTVADQRRGLMIQRNFGRIFRGIIHVPGPGLGNISIRSFRTCNDI
jgi:hypothetical protein